MDFGSPWTRWRFAGLLVFFFGASLALVTALAGADLVRAAFEGRTIEVVDRNLAIHQSLDPATRDLSYYVTNGLPVLYRLCMVLGGVGLILFVAAVPIRKTLYDFWNEPARAQDLALFRMTVFGAMAWWWWNNPLTLYTSLPSALISSPPGLSWAASILALPSWFVAILSWTFLVACLMAMVGYRTVWTATGATILAIYVLGVPQFFGKIDHYHHFVWFGALVAASPAGDAWSVDAALRKEETGSSRRSSRIYGEPLRAAMFLMGCMYFFAGVWKFIIGGLEWGMGQTMRTILHAQWMRIDFVPAIRIDDLGMWTGIGGVGVMAFEIAFIGMVMIKRTRIWAAVTGVVFHLSVLIFTGINFWTLLVCYTVFIDTTWLSRWSAPSRMIGSESRDDMGPTRTAVMVRNVLATAALVSGVFLIDSWPVAVYPTFAGVPEPRVWTLTLESVSSEGEVHVIRPWRSTALKRKFGNSRVTGFVSQTVWAQETHARRSKAEAFIQVASLSEPFLQNAEIIRVYRDLVEVDPSRWGAEPVKRELVTVWKRSHG